MKSSLRLCEIIEKFNVKNNIISGSEDDFFESVDKAAKWIYAIVNEHKSPETINVISHLADADGFGAQIVFTKGIDRILKYTKNKKKKVKSKRVMSISQDKNSPDNLEKIVKELGGRKTIVADLSTTDPYEANKACDDLLFVEHHPPREGFRDEFTIVNPHNQGIDGCGELSASMSATYIINRVYEMLEDDLKDERESTKAHKKYLDDKIRKNPTDNKLKTELTKTKNKLKSLKERRLGLVKLREELDILSIFGIAGSKADMQEDVGHNIPMYDFLQSRGLIEKVNCPFYGYTTKDPAKVWAQSHPNFNMSYFIFDQRGLNKYFATNFRKISDNRAQIIDDLHRNFRWAFAFGGSKKGLNMAYLNSLSDKRLEELNEKVKELVGSCAVKIKHDENNQRILETNTGFEDVGFYHFSEDEKDMDTRTELARSLIRHLGGDPNKSLASQKDLTARMKRAFKDSIIAFGDRDEFEWSIKELNKQQYICKIKEPLIANLSIAETANSMTAMSKLEVGDLYMLAVEDILNKTNNGYVDAVTAEWKKYKINVFKAMRELERKIRNPEDGLIDFGNGVSFMDFRFLDDVLEGIEPRKMNGVCGGVAANTKLLPGGKGIFFTGVRTHESINGETQLLYKISGRATNGSTTQGLKINKYMEMYGGGGHGPAAACTIPIEQVGEFIEGLENFDFYQGEFR